MKNPGVRGKAIDNARFAEWLGAFEGYEVRVSRPRIEKWLGQFANKDRPVVARVLDAVDFYRPDMIADASRAMAKSLDGWSKVRSKRKGVWRFVPFTDRPGESGDTMIAAFRRANALTAVKYDELFIYKADLVRQNLGPEDSVVFVDDVAGTGQQAVDAWTQSLQELLPGGPTVYLVLVLAINKAVERIAKSTRLRVRAVRQLGPKENFFSTDCKYFNAAERKVVYEYCRRIDKKRPRGFGNCGLLVVMAHRCPNNSLPILHVVKPAFEGLFPR